MTVKAAFFDMDGTVIDSIADIHNALNAMLTIHGFDHISLEESSRFVGKGARVLIEKSLHHMGFTNVPDEMIDDMLIHYVEMMRKLGPAQTVLFDTVESSLLKLRKAGVHLAVVTNKAKGPTQDALKKLKIDALFDTVVTPEDVDAPKPQPDMLLAAASRLGVSIKDCVMVGDSMNDALAAERAGCPALLVKTGYNEGIPIDLWAKDHRPRPRVFDKMIDVTDFLLGVLK